MTPRKLDRVANLLVFENASEVTDEMREICKQADLKMFHMNDLIEAGIKLK